MLNNIGLYIVPEGHHWQSAASWISYFWSPFKPSCPASFLLCLSSPYSLICWQKIIPEIILKVLAMSTIHYSHLLSHLVIKSYQVGQAWFPFNSLLLVAPNYLVLWPGNGFVEDLLHKLQKNWCRVDLPVILWIFLLGESYDARLFPAIKKFSQLCKLSKMIESWIYQHPA